MRVRIGKDIKVRWAILTDGSALPLADRDLVLEMQDPRGELYRRDFSIEGNVITMAFPGIEQTKVGDYSFTLWENKGGAGQTVVDRLSAFSLVRYTIQEDFTQHGEQVEVLIDLGTSSLTTISGGTTSVLVANLTGYRSASSTEDLPKEKSTTGFLIGTRLYVWVGEGGDTLAGLYQDCGEFRGPQGERGEQGAQGPQGNSGYQGNMDELEVVNNLTQGGESSALSAEMGKLLKKDLEDNKPLLVTPAQKLAMEAEGAWEAFLQSNLFVCVSEE